MSVSAITTAELSRFLQVSIDRIVWAHKTGRLPEPGKVGHHRAYTPEEVEMVRGYFQARDRDLEDKPKPRDATADAVEP